VDKKSWTEFVLEDDLDRMLIQHRMRRENPDIALKTYEFRLIDKNGQIKDILLTIDVIPGTKKSVASLLDISERKKAEIALIESKEYLNKIINSIGDPIFVKDRDHRFVLVNDVLCNLMGHPREEIIGRTRTDHDFFPTDQADIFWEKDEMVFKSGEENINDEKITDIHGMIRDITTKKTLYTDNAGNQFIVGISRDITDRKRADEALREARNYLENLFNHANAPIIVWDLSFRITRFNHAFEHLTGRSAEKVIGQRLDILFPESSRDTSFSKIERTLAGEYWESVEIPILHEDGAVRIVLWNSANIYAEDGKTLLATIAQGTDITERKRAEERLRKAEAQYRALVEQIPAVTYTADLDEASTTLYISPQIESILGFSPEDYRADPDIWRKRLHPDDRDRVLAQLKQGHASNQPFKSEYRMIARDGQIVWLSDEAVAVRDSTGKPLFLQGVMADITERRQTEAKLNESERRLADIINFLPDATLVIDKEGKVIAWNRAIEAMTGIKAEEILGKGNYEYAIPFYGERRPILIDLVLKPHAEIEKEYTHLRRQHETLTGGAYMPVLKGGGIFLVGSAAALYDSDGNISGAIESIRDVTENKHAAEALRKSKEAAEAAAIAKSEFLANMSHEIRTPMNAVIGMTGLLLNSDLNPDQMECVEMIHSSGEALLSVINDILDFSKIDSGKMGLERQPFDLRSCVKESLDMMGPKAAEKGLNLTCIINDSVPITILSDPTRLRQILINLLSNAIKFTEKGEVEVSIASLAIEHGKSTLHIAVRDTGIGIPQERMDKLFQSFSQVDMSTTRKYGGTGLGLAISKRLIETMGGGIWVESEVGLGSKFHFTLPVGVSLNSLPKPIVAHSQPRSSVQANIRILMAEDNAVNQKVLLKMLGRLGYRADVAADGIEALKMLERQKYDLVLMDIQMPEMDGVEATREIRQRWPNGPMIVALTAYALEGDREKCLEAGMDGYIAKPVKMDDLKAALIHYEAQIVERPGSCKKEGKVTGLGNST
ncbi:MAG TPA: PAS domain S-box protein, partial [Methanotrichaceae archaeon]|nr:PAS domain S-box protein [Methanotrichaceae archaeon]